MSSAGPSARLRLFGGATLEDDHGPITGRGAQRRRLGLLALLATANRPISRDKLIGFLWEEADTDRARKLLSESLYVIRKALGEDAIVVVGDAVLLNKNVIWSDAAEFNAALERGDDEGAATLYAGPFLDGFFLSDAHEFDGWMEAERASIARSRAEALSRLAARAESAGDLSSAAAWWRKLCEQDPYNSTYALGLMRMLDASGDRTGAFQHARTHTALLRKEFDAEPDSQIEAFAQSLQVSAQAVEAAPRITPSHKQKALTNDPVSSPVAMPVRRRRARAWQRIGVSALVVTAGAFVFWIVQPPATPPTSASASLVAVLPFSVHGSATELRAGMADLLSTNLDGAADLRSVDPHAVLSLTASASDPIQPRQAMRLAERFAATYFVLGDVTQGGTQLQVTATLYQAATGAVITRASTRGPVDSLLVLVDQIAAQLVARRGGASGELMRLAASTTASYPALKHYLDGESHYRAARYNLAVNSYVRSLQNDPTFALANYRLSAAAEWNFEFSRARAAAQRAVNNSARLPEQYQPLVRAWSYFLGGKAEAAQRTYESILSLYPSSVEARSGLGEVLVHFNPVRGLPQDAARDVFARVVELTPAYGEVRYHTLEFAARDNNRPRFDSLLASLPPSNPQYQSWHAVRAFTWGSAAEQTRVLDALRRGNELAIGIAAGRLAAHTHNFADARTIARELTRSSRTPQWQAGGQLLIADLFMANGQTADALNELRAAGAGERDWTVEMGALFALHPYAASTREALLAQRSELLAWQPSAHSPNTTFFLAAHAGIHKHLRLYLLGLVTARLGDLAHAQRYRRELEQLGGAPESQQIAVAFSRSLGGHIARAHGDRAQALELLTTAVIDAPPEFVMLSPFYSRAFDRFTIADLYRELGNRAEARRWYGSLLDGYDFLYVPAAQARIRQL